MGAVINGNSTTIKGWSPFWYIIVLIQIYSLPKLLRELFTGQKIFRNILGKWSCLDRYIFAGTTGAGALVYLIFASAEPQASIIGNDELEPTEVEKDIHGDNKYVKELSKQKLCTYK